MQPRGARPECRVAREQHLAARREDSHAIVGAWIGGRQEEGGFCKVCPCGKTLHLFGRQTIRVHDNSQAITLIWDGAKDITLNETADIHKRT